MIVDEPVERPLGQDGRPVRTLQLHRGQLDVMTREEQILVLPAGRRWGKSEVAGLWLSRKAMQARLQRKAGLLWMVAPTYRHCGIGFQKVLKVAPKGWITNVLGTMFYPRAIYFGNVIIEFRSADVPESLVGEGLIALWADECGILPERVWTESLRPTMIDFSAPALLTGTPKGRNWYWKQFMKGQAPEFPHIHSFAGGPSAGHSSYENPFLPRRDIDDLAADMPRRTYEQEILATFLSEGGGVFRNVRHQMIGGEAYLERFKEGERPLGPTISLGVDLARRVDFTVLVGMDRDCRMTYFDRFNDINWPTQKKRILAAYEALGKPVVVVDATPGSVGDPIAQDLHREGIRLEPFGFTGPSRTSLIESLMIGLEQGHVWLGDEPVLVNELEAFDVEQMPSGNVRYDHPKEGHDDCVMALGLAYRGAKRYGDIGITVGRGSRAI